MSKLFHIFTTFQSLDKQNLNRLEDLGNVHFIGNTNREEQLKSIASADAFLGPAQVNEEFFKAAPNLKVVSTSSVGYDRIDVPTATKHKIAVCNTPVVLNGAVADLTLLLILMLSRRILENEAFSRSGSWANREPLPELGHDITGKTLGIIGFGRIGQEVAKRMMSLGMRILWYDILKEVADGTPTYKYSDLTNLLKSSDFISIHTNLNDQSHHMIGEKEFSLMRESAYLINTSRGPVIDQKALFKVLQSNRIAGAGLDVLEQEPPQRDDPITSLPNVITLPHMASATYETREAMRDLAVDNVISVLSGIKPKAIVNPEVL